MSNIQTTIDEFNRARSIVQDEQLSSQIDFIAIITSIPIDYWVYGYCVLALVGLVLIFSMRFWGIAAALEIYDDTPYFKYAVAATFATLAFCPLAKFYVKALQYWILKIQYREWKKNLSF